MKQNTIDILVYVKEKTKDGTLIFNQVQNIQRIIAVQGDVGDKVQIILNDETYKAEPEIVGIDEITKKPDWIVKKLTGPGQWIIKDSIFMSKYELDPEQPGVFKPKEGPLVAAQIPEDITFVSPMNGDIQSIKVDGFLLMDPTNLEKVYGMEKEDFYSTYEFVMHKPRIR